MSKYGSLKITARQFLALKRTGQIPSHYNKGRLSFATYGIPARFSDGLYTPTKQNGYTSGRVGRGKNGEAYLDNFDSFRECGDASDIVKRLPLGYYLDNFQNDKLIACVVQLPARRGASQYYPATRHSDIDGFTVYLDDVCDDKEEAARLADGYAESVAEQYREDDIRYQAEQQIEQARDLIAECRKEHSQLASEIRITGQSSPAICAALRRELLSYRQEVRAAIKQIQLLTAEPWRAVS